MVKRAKALKVKYSTGEQMRWMLPFGSVRAFWQTETPDGAVEVEINYRSKVDRKLTAKEAMDLAGALASASGWIKSAVRKSRK